MRKVFAAIVLGVAAGSVRAQSETRFIQLDTGPGGAFTPMCMSADGSTVAGPIAVGSGVDAGYVLGRWTLAAGLTAFPRSSVQPTWPATDFPVGLSRDGSIIGATVGNRQHMAARWSLEHGFEVVPQLDTGSQQTNGVAMSSDGRYMVGTGSTNGGSRAFRADFVTLSNLNLSNVAPNPTPDRDSGAYALDATGNKVVGAYASQGSLINVPCLWENGTTRTTLNCPPPLAHWFPSRISGDGLVLCGRGDFASAPGVLVPFRWSAQAGLELLPTGPLWESAFVQYIDRTGATFAGGARISNVDHAVLWLPGEGSTTVDAYCDAHGFVRNGLHFSALTGLSADGKIALLSGTRNGVNEAWMLRLPGAIGWCAGDLGGQGGQPSPDGQLDNNDFITFIAYFFTRNARADVGKQGGMRGADFQLDNNDFIAFINLFFQGCQ
ncbi:MAG: GC-type dockerin domain-anchored protein [Phycisphaerales bacterium]